LCEELSFLAKGREKRACNLIFHKMIKNEP
jgi:hypothetical protein